MNQRRSSDMVSFITANLASVLVLLKYRSETQLKHDPWGKAGPGGAPWRNPREIGQSFMKSMVNPVYLH